MSYLSATLSSEQRPFFLVTLLFSKTFLSLVIQMLNPVNRRNREHRRKGIPQEYVTKDNTLKSLGYSINIRYALATHIKPQLTFFPLE